MIYSADVMQTSNMAGLYTQVCYHRSLLWDREVREISVLTSEFEQYL